MQLNKEHYRAYIYIELQSGRKPSEIHQQLQQTDLNVPSQSVVFEWCKRFKEGRKSLEDDMRVGRPCSSTTPAQVDVIRDLVEEEPRQSIRILAESSGLTKDAVSTILHQHLGLRKVCSVWIPHHLSDSKKRDRMACAEGLLQQFRDHPLDYLQH